MSDKVKTSIAMWCQEAMNAADYDKPCDRIGLFHITMGGTETEVRVLKIGNGRSWTAEALGNALWNAAQTYCQDLANTHTFKLYAFFGEAEPKMRHPFLVSGQFDNHGLGTEPPTPEGRTMQTMRHTEALISTLMAERLAVLDMPLRTMRAMTEYQAMIMKDNHDLRRENAEFIGVMKEVLMQEAAKRAEHDLNLKKFEQSARDREMLMKIAPMLLNELTGKEIVPQETADTLLIDTIAERLDEKSVEALVSSGVIPPELLGILMSRFRKSLAAKKQRHEDALARGSETEEDAKHLLSEGTNGRH